MSQKSTHGRERQGVIAGRHRRASGQRIGGASSSVKDNAGRNSGVSLWTPVQYAMRRVATDDAMGPNGEERTTASAVHLPYKHSCVDHG
jgi:hypothetical protein